MITIQEYLLEFGFKEKVIPQILESHYLLPFRPETLLNNIKKINDYFLNEGYTKEEIIKKLTQFPALYSYSLEALIEKRNSLLSLGYTEQQLNKLTKKFIRIYSYKVENIKEKIQDLLSLGYTQEEVIKMTNQLPMLYCLSMEIIKEKINHFINLGYSKKDILEMTKHFPALYSYSIENIKQKFQDLLSLGYTQEEVIKITKTLPSLYGYNIENIKEKIEYLKEIKLENIIVSNPRILMQSIELIHARYEFYKREDINITISNYRMLFITETKFKKRYDITNKEIRAIYPYKEESKKLKK